VNGVLVCEEFLAASEAELLWRFAMEREPMFVASEVISGTDGGRRDDEFRRSRVLYELPGVHELLSQRVFEHLPLVFQRLGVAPFTVRHVELQATATNDGEWFKPHRDSGDGEVGTRQVTFVYYCHREPRPFAGGVLRMFGPSADGDDEGDAYNITPAQNMIVFFPTNYLHEVAYVSCPSRRFEDSRLTYNGWLHR